MKPMKALNSSFRVIAAVMALSASFVLVGCADEDTTDEQTQNQTGTTFSGTIGSGTGGNEIGDRHAAAKPSDPFQQQAAVIDPMGNP